MAITFNATTNQYEVDTTGGAAHTLADLDGLTGVVTSFEGGRQIYTITAVDGAGSNTFGAIVIQTGATVTIDPEVEALRTDANRIFIVESGGRLNIGGITAAGNRPLSTQDKILRGTAIYANSVPPLWFSGLGISVASGAELNWIGATVQGPTSFRFFDGSTANIENAIMYIRDINTGTIDPATGANVAANTGSQGNSNSVLAASRGYISYSSTTDIRVNGLQMFNGGEFIFQANPAGTNGISNQPNTIEGLARVDSVIGAYPNRVNTFTLRDTTLGNNNNDVDVTIQSEGNGTTVGTANNGVLTRNTVINEAAGSNMRILGAELADGLVRNNGTAHIYREFAINASTINDASQTVNIADGGRLYITDTDNGQRANETFTTGVLGSNTSTPLANDIVIDNSGTRIYSGAATNGVVQVTQASTTNSRADEPDGILLGAVVPPFSTGGTGRGTTNAGTRGTGITEADNRYAIDVRGKTNVQGADLFDVFYWHPLYNFIPLVDVDMSDGSTGRRNINLSYTIDTSYQTAAYAAADQVANIDEVYKAIKDLKVTSDDEMALPTPGTLYGSVSSNSLDIAALNLVIAQTTATNRFNVTTGTFTANVGAGNQLVNGSLITGITTTGDINFNNLDMTSMSLSGGNLLNVPPMIDATSLAGTITRAAGDAAITYLIEPQTDVSGLTITNNSSNVVTIAGKVMSDFAALDGTGTFNFIALPQEFTVTPEIPAGSNGRFIIKEVGTSNTIVRNITNGVIDGTDFRVSDNSSTSYIAYYKLDGVFTAPVTDYAIAIRSFTGTGLTGNLVISPVEFPSVFTSALVMPTTQVATFVASTTDAIRLNWSGNSANDAPGTASQIMVARDADAWIDWHAANDFTTEYYSLGANFAGSWNNSVAGISGVSDTEGVIFRSDTGSQRQVTQQVGFNQFQAGTSPNTYFEVFSTNVGAAPLGIVLEAVSTSMNTQFNGRGVTRNNQIALGRLQPINPDDSQNL